MPHPARPILSPPTQGNCTKSATSPGFVCGKSNGVRDALAEYLRMHRLHGKSAAQTEKVAEAHILPAFEKRPVEALTAREIQRWLEKLATAAARIRGKTVTRDVDPDDRGATYVIRRRNAWQNAEELDATAGVSLHIGNDEMSDRIRWLRSYVVKEADGTLGTVCIYEASDEHARRVGMPADEITLIGKTVIIRDDPVETEKAA